MNPQHPESNCFSCGLPLSLIGTCFSAVIRSAFANSSFSSGVWLVGSLFRILIAYSKIPCNCTSAAWLSASAVWAASISSTRHAFSGS